MPGRDGTGPLGEGAITGRGLGSCTGANSGRAGGGLGRGIGRGLGRGCRRGVTEKDLLTEQKKQLENKIDIINKQLE